MMAFKYLNVIKFEINLKQLFSLILIRKRLKATMKARLCLKKKK